MLACWVAQMQRADGCILRRLLAAPMYPFDLLHSHILHSHVVHSHIVRSDQLTQYILTCQNVLCQMVGMSWCVGQSHDGLLAYCTDVAM